MITFHWKPFLAGILTGLLLALTMFIALASDPMAAVIVASACLALPWLIPKKTTPAPRGEPQ